MRKKCTELSNNEYVEKTYKFFFCWIYCEKFMQINCFDTIYSIQFHTSVKFL